MKVSERVSNLAWPGVRENLWAQGFARLGKLLAPEECEQLRSLYAQPELFRSRVDMARFRFGRGEYQYLAYPLPELVADLREALYRHLAATANEWMAALSLKGDFPGELEAFLKRCHARDQKRPTPLLLRYRAGDFNCLHQDVYGAVAFPLQLACFLSQPGVDYEAGEFVRGEQQPLRPVKSLRCIISKTIHCRVGQSFQGYVRAGEPRAFMLAP